jgi:hypothetical protein
VVPYGPVVRPLPLWPMDVHRRTPVTAGVLSCNSYRSSPRAVLHEVPGTHRDSARQCAAPLIVNMHVYVLPEPEPLRGISGDPAPLDATR